MASERDEPKSAFPLVSASEEEARVKHPTTILTSFRRYSIRTLLVLLVIASIGTFVATRLLNQSPTRLPLHSDVTRITMQGLEYEGRRYRGDIEIPAEDWAEVLAALEPRADADAIEFATPSKAGYARVAIDWTTESPTLTTSARTRVEVYPDDRGRTVIVVYDPLTAEELIGIASSETELMRTLEGQYRPRELSESFWTQMKWQRK